MTHAFVAFWKQRAGCKACIKLTGKSMCSKCLKKARVGWHRYVARRVTKRLCIQCPRKPLPAQQRCRVCAQFNRARCINWYHQVGYDRVLECKSAGTCVRCRKRPAGAGHMYCDKCRARNRALVRGAPVIKKPYKFLRMVA